MTIRPSPEAKQPRALRFLHLGDSYTCAEGIDTQDGWPAQFARLVSTGNVRVGEQKIIARTGWTTGELLVALNQSPPAGDWDLVTLCIGVNNQYRGLNVDVFAAELEQLIKLATGLLVDNSAGLHLLSIPDWSASPFARDRDRDRPEISRRIDRFNSSARTLADKFNIVFHDWTPLTRGFSENASGFIADGLHPSALQHRAWAEWLVSATSTCFQ